MFPLTFVRRTIRASCKNDFNQFWPANLFCSLFSFEPLDSQWPWWNCRNAYLCFRRFRLLVILHFLSIWVKILTIISWKLSWFFSLFEDRSLKLSSNSVGLFSFNKIIGAEILINCKQGMHSCSFTLDKHIASCLSQVDYNMFLNGYFLWLSKCRSKR